MIYDEQYIKERFGENLDDPRITVTPPPPHLHVELELTEGKEPIALAAFIIYPDTTAKIDLIEVEDSYRGTGIGKTVLSNMLSLVEELSNGKINIKAMDVGGYIWAKYGSIPTAESWIELKSCIGEKLTGLQHPVVEVVNQALQSDDPRALWLVADSVLGKDLLFKVKWEGMLDLNDPISRTRFEAYLQRGKFEDRNLSCNNEEVSR